MGYFEEMIKARNDLLNAAEKFNEIHKDKDEDYTFKPMCGQGKKVIQIKVFYGTREEGIKRGYTWNGYHVSPVDLDLLISCLEVENLDYPYNIKCRQAISRIKNEKS